MPVILHCVTVVCSKFFFFAPQSLMLIDVFSFLFGFYFFIKTIFTAVLSPQQI